MKVVEINTYYIISVMKWNSCSHKLRYERYLELIHICFLEITCKNKYSCLVIWCEVFFNWKCIKIICLLWHQYIKMIKKKKNIYLMFFQAIINLGRYIIGSVIAVVCVCVCCLISIISYDSNYTQHIWISMQTNNYKPF
jgi:K+-sensing histidine kinase KdpD